MFKKVNNWLDQPVSRKDYLRINLVLTGISAVGMGVYAIIMFWDSILSKLEKIRNKILDFPIIRFFRRGRA